MQVQNIIFYQQIVGIITIIIIFVNEKIWLNNLTIFFSRESLNQLYLFYLEQS